MNAHGPTFRRREALALAAASLVVGSLAGCEGPTGPLLLPHAAAATELGKAALEALEGPRTPDALAQQLFGAPAETALQDLVRARGALADRHRDDVANGRFLRVSGWLLTASEARGYALVAALAG